MRRFDLPRPQMAVDHLEMMELRQLLCPVTYWVSPVRSILLRPANGTLRFLEYSESRLCTIHVQVE